MPTTVLIVQASARTTGSLSRALTHLFLQEWAIREPAAEFIHRDIGLQPPGFINEAWIAAAFIPPAERSPEQRGLLRQSDELVEEVARADVIVIATPMYNYGMPAALKAWFDLVIRVGKTFTFDLSRGDWPLQPILRGKRLVVLTSKGEFGFQPGGPRHHMNHLDPHIATAARYLGVYDKHFIGIEYQEFGDKRHQRSIQNAQESVTGLVRFLNSKSKRSNQKCN